MRIRSVFAAASVLVASMAWSSATPVAASATGFVSLSVPARLLDTRPGTTTVDGHAVGGGVVAANTVREVKVGTRAGIPVDAAAVVVNVTAVESTGPSYATIYACDQPLPVASNLNFVAGQTVPNLVITRMSADGKVCIYAGPGGGAHFIVDAAGYFPAGTDFVGLSVPARLLDTRPGTTTVDGHAVGGGVVAANTVREVKVGTRAGIPVDAAAVVVNVTAVESTGPSYATIYACDQPLPVSSNLNFVAGQTVPNLVVTRMSGDGKVCIYAGPGGGAHFIVDAIGYLPAGTELRRLAGAGSDARHPTRCNDHRWSRRRLGVRDR